MIQASTSSYVCLYVHTYVCIENFSFILLYIRTYNQLPEELPNIGDQGDLRAHTEVLYIQ